MARLRGLTLPGPLQRRSEGLAQLITTGFLPQRFRDEMRLPWDARRQRRFPFNALLVELDWRIRTGRPLV